ncbi:MAG: phage integrase SAM-like domain-containing protein [Marinifilaceae bacterium]|nr:phage integrase SAM-like domain-containing protein [Marinifilaceae bacterium]
MSNVRFSLRSPKSDTETPIHLIYRLKTEKLVYPLGVKVHPSHWKTETQRVRNVAAAKNKVAINTLLNNLENKVSAFVDGCIVDGLPLSKFSLKKFLDDYFAPVNEQEKSFFGFIDKLILSYEGKINPSTGRPITKGTIKSLKGTKAVLELFETAKYRLSFDVITLDFYYDFIAWCNTKNYATNNTGKHIKNLKMFMGEAVEKELTNNIAFKSKRFVVLKEEVDNIYLTINELKKMYQLDLSAKPQHERARDLFLIGAFTGLRVSDFNDLKPENIIKRIDGYRLKVDTKKTGQKVIIPLHPIVVEILEKNGGKPPKTLPDQTINYKIKDVGELAELDEIETSSKSKGGLKVSKHVPKYMLIKTHTARRSFCTNAYLTGVPVIDIMAISTHTTESSFMKYIKVTKEQQADRMAQHPFFTGKAI